MGKILDFRYYPAPVRYTALTATEPDRQGINLVCETNFYQPLMYTLQYGGAIDFLSERREAVINISGAFKFIVRVSEDKPFGLKLSDEMIESLFPIGKTMLDACFNMIPKIKEAIPAVAGFNFTKFDDEEIKIFLRNHSIRQQNPGLN